ncbi:hypothetical protein VNI00_002727 [Paramarasmius palmivorus]|uniref:Uncharacterized protein n=1 Tax=Paramarasmius palmivorus TaxID=297713 RepID=A0AAW0DX47_9AGAR
MDTDFCLTCQCHFDGPGVFCSRECQQPSYVHIRSPSEFDGDEDNDYFTDDVEEPIYHRVEDASAHTPSSSSPNLQYIRQWAANIPAGPPPDTPQVPPIQTIYPRPKLLSSSQKPMPPSLCMSKPDTSSLGNYKQKIASTSTLNIDTLPSPATESSLATPTSSTSPVAFPSKQKSSTLFSFVRSYVSPHAHHSYAKEIASHLSPSHSLSPSECGDHEEHESAIWWIPDVPLQDSPLKKSPAQLISKKRESDHYHCFQPGYVPRRSIPHSIKHDVPPHHSRGRQISRAIA